jgi:lipopolysaccharide transport system permease protein
MSTSPRYSSNILLKNSLHGLTDSVICNLEELYSQATPHQTYSSESPLKSPRLFLNEALRDLAASSYSAYRLFRSQIVQRYRHSSFGLLWAFAPSALTAAVVTLAQRAQISGLSPSDVPGQFYAVFGLIVLQTFLEPLNTQRTLFTANGHLLNRRGPILEASMLSGLADNLFGLAIKLPLFIGMFLVCNVTMANTILLGIGALQLTLLLGSCVGLLLAPWNGLKKDLSHMMVFIPGLLFAITPVVLEPATSSRLYSYYQYNPLTWIFEAVRHFSYGYATTFDGVVLAGMTLIALIGLPLSWFFCRLARPFVVERTLL